MNPTRIPSAMQLATWRRDVCGLSLDEAARKAGIPQRHAAAIEAHPDRATVGAVAAYCRALGGTLELHITGPGWARCRLALALVGLVCALLGACAVPPGEASFRVDDPDLRSAAERAAVRLEAASGIWVEFVADGAPIHFDGSGMCGFADACVYRFQGAAAAAGNVLHAAMGVDAPRVGTPLGIAVSTGMQDYPEGLEDLILHELWHWFGVREHAEDGVRKAAAGERQITAADLEALCSAAACGWMQPEVE